MTKRICFVVPKLDRRSASHYHHVYELIEELAKQQTIFLFAESGSHRNRVKWIAGSYVQRQRGIPLRLLERSLIFSILLFRGYRTFYCHYAITSSVIAKILTTLFGGRTYLWMCVKTHLYEPRLALPTLKEKLIKDFPIRMALRNVDGLVTCSATMKNYYINHYGVHPRRISVIPNWVNLKRFSSGEKTRKLRHSTDPRSRVKTILYVHRLSPRKGADRLPAIVQAVVQQRDDVRFLIVGDGPLFSSLQRRFRSGVSRRWVRLIGPVANRKIPQYFQAADLFLNPSRTEEFGRVFLEAMASGVPIVATETDGSQTVLSPAQRRLSVTQRSERQVIRELAAKIIKLLKNERLCRSLVTDGYRRVKAFTLQRATRDFSQKII